MINKIQWKERPYSTIKYIDNSFNKSSKRILLVEDEKILQITHSLFLKSINIKFDLAATGEEALKLFKENTYDLILLDLQLPDIMGFEVSRSIRSNPKGQNVPIIALSGLESSIKQKCLEAGMNDMYSKPISYEDLSNIVLTNLGSAAQN